MGLTGAITILLLIALAIIISSLPLYFAVLILGGNASIIRVFVTNIIVGVITALGYNFLGFGSFGMFIVVIILYSFIFEMNLIKALIAWIVQYVIAAAMVVIAVLALGLSVALPF